MKLSRVIALLGFLRIANSGSAQELTRILFIFDASNSMNAKWGSSQTRFEAAKEVLIKSIDSIKGSENLEIALRVYGHQSPITTTYQDCNDTKLEVPFAKSDCSNNKVFSPRLAASTAMPKPVAPPPIIIRSHSGISSSSFINCWRLINAGLIFDQDYLSFNISCPNLSRFV